ncbi:hypothetical protein AVEN_103808-1 [Araneus ventricosus]|uniref:Uncharacterized protein n=1 Tax=Araneus ventricosus TaxID=182803 RepID=A0A4Y2G8V3_ARAVE|nr:hypothetical protein AVEN_103808-1 [Araneus ventricosus]
MTPCLYKTRKRGRSKEGEEYKSSVTLKWKVKHVLVAEINLDSASLGCTATRLFLLHILREESSLLWRCTFGEESLFLFAAKTPNVHEEYCELTRHEI